jgi:hypothetical protein
MTTNGDLSGGSDTGRFDVDSAGEVDDRIREDMMRRIQDEGHDMPVKDAAGDQIGTVDHLDGDRLKLTKSGSMDGQHHYVPLSAVESMDDVAVYLNIGKDEVE